MNRFVIRIFTLVLIVLVFWLLGFVVQDIRTMQGPDYQEIEQRHVDSAQLDRQKAIGLELKRVERAISKRQSAKNALGSSTQGLQKTIGQLIELQRLGMEKELTFSGGEQAAFADSLTLFLANQERDQALSQEIVNLVEEQNELQQTEREVAAELDRQRIPAREEYQALLKAHKFRLALYQLLILSPFLVVSVWLCVRKRSTPSSPFISRSRSRP